MKESQLETYHRAWLLKHPQRSLEWFLERIADGFQIHHVDGDHANDCPTNLVMVDGIDHLGTLHHMKIIKRISAKELGSMAGKANVAKHGVEHMKKIGRKANRARWRKVRERAKEITAGFGQGDKQITPLAVGQITRSGRGDSSS